MEPLAHNPSSELHISGLDSISASVHEATGTVPRSDSDRLPSSIVGVPRKGVGAERKRVDVELQIGVVEVGGRTLARRIEDRVGQTGASVVGDHCKMVR